LLIGSANEVYPIQNTIHKFLKMRKCFFYNRYIKFKQDKAHVHSMSTKTRTNYYRSSQNVPVNYRVNL